MKSHFETPAHDRKGLVLCGISGSGKTQLVREYISRQGEDFSSVLWINAASEMSVEQSLGACANRICHEFPELQDCERHISPRTFVLDWLRTTPYQNWLVVIDSVDNLLLSKPLLESMNGLRLGALCLTSTHPGAAKLARAKQILIERLDPAASQSLIIWRALDTEQDPGEEGECFLSIVKTISISRWTDDSKSAQRPGEQRRFSMALRWVSNWLES